MWSARKNLAIPELLEDVPDKEIEKVVEKIIEVPQELTKEIPLDYLNKNLK